MPQEVHYFQYCWFAAIAANAMLATRAIPAAMQADMLGFTLLQSALPLLFLLGLVLLVAYGTAFIGNIARWILAILVFLPNLTLHLFLLAQSGFFAVGINILIALVELIGLVFIFSHPVNRWFRARSAI